MFIDWFATNTIALELAQQQAGQPAPPPGGGLFQLVLMIGLVMAIFWFMYTRPMQKEREQHGKMISSLMTGDKVLTIGGIHGEITKVYDQTIVIKTGDKSSKITVSKTSIKHKIKPKGE